MLLWKYSVNQQSRACLPPSLASVVRMSCKHVAYCCFIACRLLWTKPSSMNSFICVRDAHEMSCISKSGSNACCLLGWKDGNRNALDCEWTNGFRDPYHQVRNKDVSLYFLKMLVRSAHWFMRGSRKEALGKERESFSTSSLISSLSCFILVKCHFAIGLQGLIAKGRVNLLRSLEKRPEWM